MYRNPLCKFSSEKGRKNLRGKRSAWIVLRRNKIWRFASRRRILFLLYRKRGREARDFRSSVLRANAKCQKGECLTRSAAYYICTAIHCACTNAPFRLERCACLQWQRRLHNGSSLNVRTFRLFVTWQRRISRKMRG